MHVVGLIALHDTTRQMRRGQRLFTLSFRTRTVLPGADISVPSPSRFSSLIVMRQA